MLPFTHSAGLLFGTLMAPWTDSCARQVAQWMLGKLHLHPQTTLRLKQNAVLFGLIYPLYNLVKRHLTSCTAKHQERFRDSSYFANSLDFACGYTASVIVAAALLGHWHNTTHVLGDTRDAQLEVQELVQDVPDDTTQIESQQINKVCWSMAILVLGLLAITITAFVLSTKPCE